MPKTVQLPLSGCLVFQITLTRLHLAALLRAIVSILASGFIRWAARIRRLNVDKVLGPYCSIYVSYHFDPHWRTPFGRILVNERVSGTGPLNTSAVSASASVNKLSRIAK